MTIRKVIDTIITLKSEGYTVEEMKVELPLTYKVNWSPLIDDIIYRIDNNCLHVNEDDLDRDISQGLSGNEKNIGISNSQKADNGQQYHIPSNMIINNNSRGDTFMKFLYGAIVAFCFMGLKHCIGGNKQASNIITHPVSIPRYKPTQIPSVTVPTHTTNTHSLDSELRRSGEWIEKIRPYTIFKPQINASHINVSHELIQSMKNISRSMEIRGARVKPTENLHPNSAPVNITHINVSSNSTTPERVSPTESATPENATPESE